MVHLDPRALHKAPRDPRGKRSGQPGKGGFVRLKVPEEDLAALREEFGEKAALPDAIRECIREHVAAKQVPESPLLKDALHTLRQYVQQQGTDLVQHGDAVKVLRQAYGWAADEAEKLLSELYGGNRDGLKWLLWEGNGYYKVLRQPENPFRGALTGMVR